MTEAELWRIRAHRLFWQRWAPRLAKGYVIGMARRWALGGPGALRNKGQSWCGVFFCWKRPSQRLGFRYQRTRASARRLRLSSYVSICQVEMLGICIGDALGQVDDLLGRILRPRPSGLC